MITYITFNIKVAWWVNLYLRALSLFSCVTNFKPDADRVGNFLIRRGIKLNVRTK